MLEMWTLVFWVYVSAARVDKVEIQIYEEDACVDGMNGLARESIAAKDRPMFCIETRTGRVIRYVY